jgi:hypothetical protein
MLKSKPVVYNERIVVWPRTERPVVDYTRMQKRA